MIYVAIFVVGFFLGALSNRPKKPKTYEMNLLRAA